VGTGAEDYGAAVARRAAPLAGRQVPSMMKPKMTTNETKPTMSTNPDTTNEVAPIEPIQSAYLNMSTAIADIQTALMEWESEHWNKSVQWIDFAIHQLSSAKYKIQAHQDK